MISKELYDCVADGDMLCETKLSNKVINEGIDNFYLKVYQCVGLNTVEKINHFKVWEKAVEAYPKNDLKDLLDSCDGSLKETLKLMLIVYHNYAELCRKDKESNAPTLDN